MSEKKSYVDKYYNVELSVEDLERIADELQRTLDFQSREFSALGAAWRSDWSDFDGRQLRDQIDGILGGDHDGSDFYHHHVVGRGPVPDRYCLEFGCTICAEAKEAQ